MMRRWILAATVGAIACASAYSMQAGDATSSGYTSGNAEAGAAKAMTCKACHGANGNSVNPLWPSLAGLGAAYITEQLENFKDGKRQNPLMMPIITSLTSTDMADLGAYFDGLPNTGLEADPAYWKDGQSLYRGGDAAQGIPACMACHGPSGQGNESGKIPALRGQHSVYVVNQLQAYATGARTTGPNTIMETIAKRLTSDEMRDLASYVQGLR